MFDKIFNEMVNIAELKFDAAGLIPAIVQDADTRVVLMQGYIGEGEPRGTDLPHGTRYVLGRRERGSGFFVLLATVFGKTKR